MGLANAPLLAFNRGLVSPLALARVDLKRLALSAEQQTNWMPRSLGSMMLRPGLQYIGSTKSDAQAKHIPFVFSTDDTAIIELTDSVMRVRVSESVVARGSVSSAVTNGNFTSNITNWTDADESGAASTWHASGYAQLVGTGFNSAILRQEVTVGASDQNDEHALRIVVVRGRLTLRIGSSAGGQQYVSDTTLGVGTHSISFTPTGNFHIQLANRTAYACLVDSVNVESSGDMEIPTPWAAADLSKLRWSQSGDVVFVACEGYQQRRIERRVSTNSRSWGISLYQPEDGPFRIVNTSTITLTPSAITGDITLEASKDYFTSSNVGSLIRIGSVGQRVELDISAENQFTDSIRLSGTDRTITIEKGGTWTATLTLQRSVGEEGNWVDVTTYATSGNTTYSDGLTNQVIYYRIGVKTGNYTSGTVEAALEFAAGSITGVCRITAFTDATTVSAQVLRDLGNDTASDDWAEGEWSDRRGWPTSVALYEGRLWWAGKDKIIGSVSDAFESFDDDTEGDSGPINRSIGSGPVDVINWLLALQRLMVGAEGAEVSARSTSFDEPLTPTNFNVKEASTQGSKAVAAVKVDTRGVYVQRSGYRVFELAYEINSNDYASTDLTILNPDLGNPGFTHLAVQRQPDTRVHALRSDGTVAVLLYNPAEDIKCWVEIETDGEVEDIFTLPGTAEDAVYYLVKRTIDGSTKRYLEKWALESECIGGTLNKQADSFITFSQSAAATVTGLDHLEGEDVVVWADGKCLDDADGEIATFTVSSGSITLTDGGASYSAATGVVGLPYTARFKSAKLAYGASLGTALGQRKRLSRLGLILYKTHHLGLRYGRDFDNLNDLPQSVDGAIVAADTIHDSFDQDALSFPGAIETDARLCLEASAPRPAQIMAAIAGVATDDDAP
jgi:hypothetical protein